MCKFQNWGDVQEIWVNSLIIISALLPMVNFVIFFVKSLLKMKTIKADIETRVKNIEQDSNSVHKNFDLLQSLEMLKMNM